MEEDFFEETDDEDGVPISPWRRALQVVVGTIFIIAIIYFSGIYQFFLFSQTPESARPKEYSQIVPGEAIDIPVVFYIIGGTQRDEENVRKLAENASRILSQAGINMEVVGVYEVKAEDSDILNSLAREDFLRNLPSYSPEVISAILSRTLSGLNGVALGRGGVLAVAEYTSGFDFRTLAHEVGHVLGLGHTQKTSRLMNSGGRGEELTIEEARVMRNKARQFAKDMLQ